MPHNPDDLPQLTDEKYARMFKLHALIRSNFENLSGAEVKILETVLGDSLAVDREEAFLSINDFVSGYDDERGCLGASGLSRSGIQNAISSLLAKGIITRNQASARKAHAYKIEPLML